MTPIARSTSRSRRRSSNWGVSWSRVRFRRDDEEESNAGISINLRLVAWVREREQALAPEATPCRTKAGRAKDGVKNGRRVDCCAIVTWALLPPGGGGSGCRRDGESGRRFSMTSKYSHGLETPGLAAAGVEDRLVAELLLRVARRADALARAEGVAAPGRSIWLRAEWEILSAVETEWPAFLARAASPSQFVTAA